MYGTVGQEVGQTAGSTSEVKGMWDWSREEAARESLILVLFFAIL